MPIYEYICDDCGAHYERIVLNQKTKVTCPKCESGKHTIQLSVFAAPANGGSKSSGGSGPTSGGGCCGRACGCH
jgi:putative FmdB family regulatory protein